MTVCFLIENVIGHPRTDFTNSSHSGLTCLNGVKLGINQ